MDDDQETEEFEVLIPAFPFVQSAALADVLQMAADVAQAQAALFAAFADRAAADHNHKVQLAEGMDEAAQELETLVKGDTDGDS